MVFCKECKYMQSDDKEWKHQFRKFTEVGYSDLPLPRTPYDRPQPYTFSVQPICQHTACFEEKVDISPMEKKVWSRRIAGQVQLNRNNTCKYFEPIKPTPPKYRTIEGVDPSDTSDCLKDKPWWKFW